MNKIKAPFHKKAAPVENGGHAWTPVRVDVLRAQWALGSPVREIAALLGVTRNTVIGKAHRIGLPTHTGSVFHPDAPRKREQRKAQGMKPRVLRIRPRVVAPVAAVASPPPPPSPGVAPQPLRLPFAELQVWSCRYSVSREAPHFFCGQPRWRKSAFCAFHHALCYEPLRGKPGDLKRNRGRFYARAA